VGAVCHGLEVAPTYEPLGYVRAGELVDRQPVPTWRGVHAPGPVWDLEPLAGRTPVPLERGDRSIEVRDAVDEDGSIPAEVAGQQDRRLMRAETQHGYASAERLDREHHTDAENRLEVLDVGGDIAARHVEEVETLEPLRLVGLSRLRGGHGAMFAHPRHA
jgi:hypothetical protein